MSHRFAGPALRLTTTQYETIVAHCYDGLDDEACGLLIGPLSPSGEPTGQVSEVRPCRNADASTVTYTIDSRDMLGALRAAEARGEEIVGVWHSHTHTDAYPSPTDVRQAVDPAWLYVIVSMREPAPTMHAYRIRDGGIAEVPIQLDR